MSVERNKGIVRRLFEVWNTGNVDAIEELYAALSQTIDRTRR